MKSRGLLNSNLLAVITQLGHGDMLTITDRGFPFPLHKRTETIDLSITKNLPHFLDVVKPVIEEMELERVIIAREMKRENPQIHDELIDIVGKMENKGQKIKIDYITHQEFKTLILYGAEKGKPIVCMVRTGEFTPFANIILVAGVPF